MPINSECALERIPDMITKMIQINVKTVDDCIE